MAGEIQLNSTTLATESSGSITAQLDTIRPNTTNGSLTLQGDSSDAGVTGLTIDSSGNAAFAQTISGGTLGSSVVFPTGHIIQTVSSSFNGVQTIGTSDTDITDLNCSMTIASGNKVLILVNLYAGQGVDDYGIFRIVNGSNIAIYQNSTGTGSQSNASMISTVSGSDTNDVYKVSNHSLNYLWTPGVTSITVKVRGRCTYGSSLYINRAEDTSNAGYANRATSHLTIMEVVA